MVSFVQIQNRTGVYMLELQSGLNETPAARVGKEYVTAFKVAVGIHFRAIFRTTCYSVKHSVALNIGSKIKEFTDNAHNSQN